MYFPADIVESEQKLKAAKLISNGIWYIVLLYIFLVIAGCCLEILNFTGNISSGILPG